MNVPDGFMERFDRTYFGGLKTFIIGILIIISYFYMQIVFFFVMIYYNLIMLIPYLIIDHFSAFIYHAYHITRNTKFSVFFYNLILLIFYIIFGGTFYIQSLKIVCKGPAEGRRISIIITEIIHILFAIIYVIIYFPIQFFINIITLLIFIIVEGSDFMNIKKEGFEYSFGVRFYNLNY